MALFYRVEYRFTDRRAKAFPVGANLHLCELRGFVTLFVVWGLLLNRFDRLYVDTHEPAYFGPGFVDLLYQLPLIWLSIVAFLSIALSVLFPAFYTSRISRSCLLISCVIFVGMIGRRHAGFIFNLIERYVVTPNPVSAETAFMEYNIEATLNAYQLDGAQTIERDVTVTPEADLAYWGLIGCESKVVGMSGSDPDTGPNNRRVEYRSSAFNAFQTSSGSGWSGKTGGSRS